MWEIYRNLKIIEGCKNSTKNWVISVLYDTTIQQSTFYLKVKKYLQKSKHVLQIIVLHNCYPANKTYNNWLLATIKTNNKYQLNLHSF